MYYRRIFGILLLILTTALYGDERILTLVYKDIGKPPYMEEAPDNSGLYLDMISRAAEMIGFGLEVERLPKTRTYENLKIGSADIYPSGVFETERSRFLFYFPNGLYRYENYYAITSLDIPELNSVQELNDHNLQWLVELGSTQPKQAEQFGVEYYALRDIRIEKAILLINNRRPFCFRVIKEDLEHYMEIHDVSSMEELGIKVHENCFPTLASELYLGFSRASPYYQELPNRDYNPEEPLSVENFPYKLNPDSVAALLRHAFKQMIDNGEIDRLKLKYNIE